MATSTNIVEISDTEYVDISTGNLNCALMVKFLQKLRVRVADDGLVPPPADTDEYFNVSATGEDFSGVRFAMSFNNLTGEDRVYVRAEQGVDTITVVRGEVALDAR